MKYHITDDGPKPCTAQPGNCPVGGEHFNTEKAASVAFDVKMKSSLFVSSSKRREPDFSSLLSEKTRVVVDAITAAGAKPMLVGGCVRDAFVGGENKDVDIEVFGERADGGALSYRDLKKMFKNIDGIYVQEAGAAFSVLKIRLGDEEFDVSLPRTEKSTGEHHSEYDVSSDSRMGFDEASSRRDFTINSMGFDPVEKKLVDPHGGREDLQNGVLRHVGTAFSDDPLRCLRAVNFASRFDLELAPETLSLCRDLSSQYSTLSHERVEEELNKMLYKGKSIHRGMGMMYDMGWSQHMPGLKNLSRDKLVEYGEMLNSSPKSLRKAMLNYCMVRDGAGEVITFMDSSSKGRTLAHKFSDMASASSRGEVVAAHRALKKGHPEVSNAELGAALKKVGVSPPGFDDLPEKPVDPVLSGKVLLDRGFKAGPEMGRVLKRAQEIQDEEGALDVDVLLNRALRV